MKPAGPALALLCLTLLAGTIGCEGFGFGNTKKTPPEKPKPHFEQALDAESAGDYDKAMSEYRQAINETPDDSRSYVNLGRLYSRSGHSVEAEAYWTKAVEVNPRDLRAYNLLGGASMRDRDYTKAVSWYMKALNVDPNDASVHWNMAIAYRSMNMDRDAAGHYRRYLELAPNAPAEDTAEALKYLETHGRQ